MGAGEGKNRRGDVRVAETVLILCKEILTGYDLNLEENDRDFTLEGRKGVGGTGLDDGYAALHGISCGGLEGPTNLEGFLGSPNHNELEMQGRPEENREKGRDMKERKAGNKGGKEEYKAQVTLHTWRSMGGSLSGSNINATGAAFFRTSVIDPILMRNSFF